MKRFTSILVLALITVALTSSTTEKIKWAWFKDAQSKCKIKMPSSYDVEKSETDGGIPSIAASAEVGGTLYYFSCSFHDNEMEGLTELLEVSANSFQNALAAETVSSKEWNVGKLQGLQAIMKQIEGESDIDYRVIMAGKRQYQLVVAGPKGSIPSADSEVFFKSFKLSK